MDRLELQIKLEEILGCRHVYFQPPESLKIKFPAIVYSLDGVDIMPADDSKYKKYKRFSLTLIDEDPDSEFMDKILDLKFCSFNRMFAVDNLNHYNFTIYI